MNDGQAASMIKFLKEKVLRNNAIEISEDTSLVASGLVDSFALVDILLELRRVTRKRIPAGRVSPKDFETVRQMFVTADKFS